MPDVNCIDVLIGQCAPYVTLPIKATETGFWVIETGFEGTYSTDTINVTNGQFLTVPNRFNESYRHNVRIYDSENNVTYYSIRTRILYGPVSVISGGSTFVGNSSDNTLPTEAQIESGVAGEFKQGQDFEVSFAPSQPLYQWVAWPILDSGFKGYYIDQYNHENFGASGLFATPVQVGKYLITQTNYPTQIQTVKIVH